MQPPVQGPGSGGCIALDCAHPARAMSTVRRRSISQLQLRPPQPVSEGRRPVSEHEASPGGTPNHTRGTLQRPVASGGSASDSCLVGAATSPPCRPGDRATYGGATASYDHREASDGGWLEPLEDRPRCALVKDCAHANGVLPPRPSIQRPDASASWAPGLTQPGCPGQVPGDRPASSGDLFMPGAHGQHSALRRGNPEELLTRLQGDHCRR